MHKVCAHFADLVHLWQLLSESKAFGKLTRYRSFVPPYCLLRHRYAITRIQQATPVTDFVCFLLFARERKPVSSLLALASVPWPGWPCFFRPCFPIASAILELAEDDCRQNAVGNIVPRFCPGGLLCLYGGCSR